MGISPRFSIQWKGDSSWKRLAKCHSVDTSFFFPGDGDTPTQAHKTLCGDCPVNTQCLNHALMNNAQGVWAGTSKTERDALKRKRDRENRRPFPKPAA